MSEASVVVHADADLLAQAVAARLVVKLLDAQAERGQASVVLTGGRIAAAVYRAVAALPARDAVDWSRVDVWWGDERFLPAGDPDRNETQARAALLDALPLDPARVHPMPAVRRPGRRRPGGGRRPVRRRAGRGRPGPGTRALPHFDVLMLGVGEDGHVASVFPEHPVHYETRPVSAVRGSPKPPPVRITLTLPAINTAEEVWLVAAGADKARAVGMALAGAGAGAAAGGRRARRRAARSGCWTGPRRPTCRPGCAACAELTAKGPCVTPSVETRGPVADVQGVAAAVAQRGEGLGEDRLAVLRRCAAPSRTPGGSCTARCAARPGGFCASRPAGRPQRGQSQSGRRLAPRRRSGSRSGGRCAHQ